MRPRSVLILFILGVSVAVACSPDRRGYHTGWEAYRQGDYATALKEWRLPAEDGDPPAQTDLGLLYANGRGVPQNDKEAARWFRRAAEQGYAPAQYNLGVMYDQGRGVPQDDTEAVRWFRQAAEQGHAPAQYNLGVMYQGGRGVPQNFVQAHLWYNLAAGQGHEDARKGRDTLGTSLPPAELAEAQGLAREWMAKQGQ